jgi:hypothetical protein
MRSLLILSLVFAAAGCAGTPPSAPVSPSATVSPSAAVVVTLPPSPVPVRDRAMTTALHAGSSDWLRGMSAVGPFAVSVSVDANGAIRTSAPKPPWGTGVDSSQDIGALPAGQTYHLVMTAQLGTEQRMPGMDRSVTTLATPLKVSWSVVASDGTQILGAGVATWVGATATWQ